MIVRVWRTRVDRARMREYARFEQERSLPMLRGEPGFLGVLFLRTAAGCAALTIWEDLHAVDALTRSQRYQEVVRELQATGLLVGRPSIEVLEVHGGALRAEALAGSLKGLEDPGAVP